MILIKIAIIFLATIKFRVGHENFVWSNKLINESLTKCWFNFYFLKVRLTVQLGIFSALQTNKPVDNRMNFLKIWLGRKKLESTWRNDLRCVLMHEMLTFVPSFIESFYRKNLLRGMSRNHCWIIFYFQALLQFLRDRNLSKVITQNNLLVWLK